MADMIDDVVFLSQEVGPRPAGTEEEQQAALFIADAVHKRSGLRAEIEDVSCIANPDLVDMIIFGVAFLSVLITFIFPGFAVPALVLTLLSAAAYLCETLFDKPILSGLLAHDISQNVVVKYQPEQAANTRARTRRKIIVVTNYDSGRVMPEMKNSLMKPLSWLIFGANIAVIAAPVIILFRNIIFMNGVALVTGIFTILMVIDVILLAIPLARAIAHRVSAYNEGANCNASGVAVLLETIRRVGGGAPAQPFRSERVSDETEAPVVHGEEAARAEGAVDDGVELSYDERVAPTADEAEDLYEGAGAADEVFEDARYTEPIDDEGEITEDVMEGEEPAEERKESPRDLAEKLRARRSSSREGEGEDEEAAGVAGMAKNAGAAAAGAFSSLAGMAGGLKDRFSGRKSRREAEELEAMGVIEEERIYEETYGDQQEMGETVVREVSPVDTDSSAQEIDDIYAEVFQSADVDEDAPTDEEPQVVEVEATVVDEELPPLESEVVSSETEEPVVADEEKPKVTVVPEDMVTADYPVAEEDETFDEPNPVSPEERLSEARATLAALTGMPVEAGDAAVYDDNLSSSDANGYKSYIPQPSEAEKTSRRAQLREKLGGYRDKAVEQFDRHRNNEDEQTPVESVEYGYVAESAEDERVYQPFERSVEPTEESPAFDEVEAFDPTKDQALPVEEPIYPAPDAGFASADTAPVPLVEEDGVEVEEEEAYEAEDLETPVEPSFETVSEDELEEEYVEPYVSEPVEPEEFVVYDDDYSAPARTEGTSADSFEEADEEDDVIYDDESPVKPAYNPSERYTPSFRETATAMGSGIADTFSKLKNDSPLPDWFKNAKAKATRDEEMPEVRRSRYADALDAAVEKSSEEFANASRALDEETESRLNRAPRSISEVPAPTAEEIAAREAQRALLADAEPGAPAEGSAPHASTLSEALQRASRPKVESKPVDVIEEAFDEDEEGVFADDILAEPPVADVLPIEPIVAAPRFDAEDTAPMQAIDVEESVEVNTDLVEDDQQTTTPESSPVADLSQDEVSAEHTIAMKPIDTSALQADSSAFPTPEKELDSSAEYITLPEIGFEKNMPPVTEVSKQRAPLAEATEEGGQAAARTLLSGMLPRINVNDLSGDLGKPVKAASTEEEPSTEDKRANLMTHLPSLSGSISKDPKFAKNKPQTVVSPTGSFTAIGNAGAIEPVGDELVADVAPEDRYVDDADDSVYEGSVTETGAFAGPEYVDMPKSRVQGFFGRRKHKEADEDFTSQKEWIGVDENFEARAVGKARGDWSSFRDDSHESKKRMPAEGEGDYDDLYGDDEGETGWRGGAFSGRRSSEPASERPASGRSYDQATADRLAARRAAREAGEAPAAGRAGRRARGQEATEAPRRHSEAPVAEEQEAPRRSRRASKAEAPVEESRPRTARAVDTGLPADLLDRVRVEEEVEQVYDFRDSTLETETWFVALGAEMSGNAGFRAFMKEHAEELRGAIVVNIEAMGAGELAYGAKAGTLKHVSPSTRIRRFLRNATQVTGVAVAQADMTWREDTASYAMKHGLQAVTLSGMDDRKPAMYAQPDDVCENVDARTLLRNADYLMEVLKSV